MAVYARRAFCAVLLLRGLQRSRKAAQKFLPVDSSTSYGQWGRHPTLQRGH